MSDILILHDGDIAQSFVVTSLIRRLVKAGGRVHCLADEQSCNLLSYTDGCHAEPIARGTRVKYDTAINITTSDASSSLIESVSAKEKLGYRKQDGKVAFYNEGADLHFRATTIGVPTNANIFQLVFGLANLTWQGEGYWLQYFPRNRTRRSLTGISVRDESLKKHLIQSLPIDKSKLYQIPFKQNILKQIDETNRCRNVITDDPVVFNTAVALRKSVEYIVRQQPAYKLEMFGRGHVHTYNIESSSSYAGSFV